MTATAELADAIRVQRPARLRGATLGAVGLLVFAQIFFVLLATDGSYLIPGSWAPFQLDMLLYLTLSLFALGPLVAGAVRPIVTEGSVGQFLRGFSLFAAGTWILLTGAFALSGTATVPVDGTLRFQYLVFIGFFVAPTEELIFRVVLPPLVAKTYTWQLVYTSLAFGAFHLPAYTAVASTPPSVAASQVLQAVGIGAVLFLVTWKSPQVPRFGFPAGVGIHTAYNLVVIGIVGGLAVVAVHLGLGWV